MLKATEAALGETTAAWGSVGGTAWGTKARCCSPAAHPLGSTSLRSTSAHHQSSLAKVLGLRFTVVPASPAQAPLPRHLPSAANLQQQHIDVGAVVI